MTRSTTHLGLPTNVHGIEALRQSVKAALEAIDGHAVSLVGSSEAVTTNGDTATEASVEVYQTVVTTGGSEGAEDLTLGDGTGVTIGTRKLITLGTRTHASDSVVLDHANIGVTGETVTAVELDAAAEFLLVEWQGAAWEVIKASAGVVTSS